MSRNMGTLDRAVRGLLVAPAAIIVAAIVGVGSTAGVVLLVIAAIMLATSAAGFCPLYTLLRVDTLGSGHRAGHA